MEVLKLVMFYGFIGTKLFMIEPLLMLVKYHGISIKSFSSITMPRNRRPTPWEKWLPPPADWGKINFDIAIRDYFSVRTAVCHNHDGHIIGMVSQLSSPCMPNFGEALSALVAVSWATSLNSLDDSLLKVSISQDCRISSLISSVSFYGNFSSLIPIFPSLPLSVPIVSGKDPPSHALLI
jgi:hypothetical protein